VQLLEMNQEENRKQHHLPQCKSMLSPYFNAIFNFDYATPKKGSVEK